MSRLIIIAVFAGAILLLSACQGNMDTSDPQITFLSPGEDYLVNVPDTIDVEVEITDDQTVMYVSVSIFDENKIPVVQTKYFEPNTEHFTLKASFELIDKNLHSGPHHIFVSAFDGNNSKDKYHPITIKEIPRSIEAYFVICGQFDFKTTIQKLDKLFETDTQFVFPHGYYNSAVNGMWENFFFISKEPSTLYAFRPEILDIEWTIAAAPPRPTITSVLTDQDLIFSTSNGDIALSDEDGGIVLRSVSYSNKTITNLAADKEYIYAAHVSLSGNIHELTVYYRVTGAIRVQRWVGGEIMCLATYDKGVLLFMRLPTGTVIMDYDPEEMTLTQLDDLDEAEIHQALKIAEGEYLLLTDLNVISYYPVGNSISVFSGQPYDFGRYDALNDMVYLVRDTRVSGYDRGSGNSTFEKIFPDQVLDFQILYNK